jgi:2-oxoglutarate-Fe(II)-dependent oxygenase superfamily protein
MPSPDLAHYVRVYDANLEAPFCRQLIDSFAALERFHVHNGRGVRAGLDESAWTELNVTRLADTGFLAGVRLRIDAALERYNQDVGLAIAVPNTPKHSDLVIKRYRPGHAESFQLHFDSIYEFATRYLVMIWYLNDVVEGGETCFPQLELAIRPQAGRLVVFPPYWMYQHKGVLPVSGDKYILSTYLLFGDTPRP